MNKQHQQLESAPKDVANQPTDLNWIDRLRKGNKVWLVKEKEYAHIEWEWEPPEPGHLTGRIAILRQHDFGCEVQTWFISSDGCGINGSLLFLPVDGNLQDDPEPIPESEIRQIRRELAQLRKEIQALQAATPLSSLLTLAFGNWDDPVN